MDGILEHLMRPGTLVVAVAVVILTFFTKKVSETAWPSLKKRATEMEAAPMYMTMFAMWWNEVILYAIPVVFGAAFGLVRSEFLHGTIVDLGGRLAFCAGTGWFSGLLYKGVRKAIMQKTGIDIHPNGSITPPAPVHVDPPAPPV